MLPLRFLYVLDGVVYIALHGASRAVPSAEIAEYLDVKKRYLETDLQILVRENLIKSTKGPKGGYHLAKEKRKITVADLFEAWNKAQNSCVWSRYAQVNHFQASLNKKASALLKATTLVQLCDGVESEGKKAEEFVI